jgi:hypothetical protein
MTRFFQSSNRLARVAGYAALLGCGVLAASSFANPAALVAQTPERVVQGKVVDKDGAGVKGATVYLKDDHTLSVRSYIASDDGSYHFGQLAQNTDYELWAEVGGKRSKTANLSSFDTRNTFNITLKIEK